MHLNVSVTVNPIFTIHCEILRRHLVGFRVASDFGDSFEQPPWPHRPKSTPANAKNGAITSLGIWPSASVYPYNGLSWLGGVVSAGFGSGGDTQSLANLLAEYQDEQGGVDVVTFSGGAQTMSEVGDDYPQLTDKIVSTTNISPGLNIFGGELFESDSGDDKSFKGSGFSDWWATLGARRAGVPMEQVAKDHDFKKEFFSKQVQDRLLEFKKQGSRGPCPPHVPVEPAGGPMRIDFVGVGGGGLIGDGGAAGGGSFECGATWFDGGEDGGPVLVGFCIGGGSSGGGRPKL